MDMLIPSRKKGKKSSIPSDLILKLQLEEESFVQYLETVLTIKDEIKDKIQPESLEAIFPSVLQDMKNISQNALDQISKKVEPVDILRELVNKSDFYANCFNNFFNAQKLIDQNLEAFSEVKDKFPSNFNFHEFYKKALQKIFLFNETLRELTFAADKESSVFPIIQNLRITVAEYCSSIDHDRDIQQRLEKGKETLTKFGIEPSPMSIFIYKLVVTKQPVSEEQLKLYLYSDFIVITHDEKVEKSYHRNADNGKVSLLPDSEHGFMIDGDTYYTESFRNVFWKKVETDIFKKRTTPNASGTATLALRRGRSFSAGHRSTATLRPPIAEAENSFISNFTVARSTTKMKGLLKFKKETYFFCLGPDALFYCSNENDETPKGVFYLSSYDKIEIMAKKESFSLASESEGKLVVLTSYSSENTSTWVSAIKKQIAFICSGISQFSFQTGTRLERRIITKVWSGRALRNGRDTFVALVADGEEKARSTTVWQTTEPVYNEEFYFIVDLNCNELSYNIYDMRKKGNFSLGSVAVPMKWETPSFDFLNHIQSYIDAHPEFYAIKDEEPVEETKPTEETSSPESIKEPEPEHSKLRSRVSLDLNKVAEMKEKQRQKTNSTKNSPSSTAATSPKGSPKALTPKSSPKQVESPKADLLLVPSPKDSPKSPKESPTSPKDSPKGSPASKKRASAGKKKRKENVISVSPGKDFIESDGISSSQKSRSRSQSREHSQHISKSPLRPKRASCEDSEQLGGSGGSKKLKDRKTHISAPIAEESADGTQTPAIQVDLPKDSLAVVVKRNPRDKPGSPAASQDRAPGSSQDKLAAQGSSQEKVGSSGSSQEKAVPQEKKVSPPPSFTNSTNSGPEDALPKKDMGTSSEQLVIPEKAVAAAASTELKKTDMWCTLNSTHGLLPIAISIELTSLPENKIGVTFHKITGLPGVSNFFFHAFSKFKNKTVKTFSLETKDGNLKPVLWDFPKTGNIVIEIFELDDIYKDLVGQIVIPQTRFEDKSLYATEDWQMQTYDPGQLRIEFSTASLCILSDGKYDALFFLIVADDFLLAKMLSKVAKQTSQLSSLAGSLIRACEKKRAAVGFVKALLTDEIKTVKSFETMFRGNTLATKSFENYLKLIGLPYLHKVLKPTLFEIMNSKKKDSCELDPIRLEAILKKKQNGKEVDPARIEAVSKKNLPNLIKYCNAVLDAIQELKLIFPMSVRAIFDQIRVSVLEHFGPDAKNAVHAGITAFLFLRFLVPAISQPTVFRLVTNHPSPDIARTLMLIATTILKLSNLKEFNKEPHLLILNSWIDKSMKGMISFLDEMSVCPTKPTDALPTTHGDIDYGQEMAGVTEYIINNFTSLEEQFGKDHATIVQLRPVLVALGTEHKGLFEKLKSS